jgi:DinB superfamily
MTNDHYRRIVLGQFDAALAMHENCIGRCPQRHWNGIIGKYPFWQVAYHALCFVDLYSAPSNEAWKPHPDFHPKGMAELRKEYPSRAFDKKELLAYLSYCSDAVHESLRRETTRSLEGPSGFSWLRMSRAEVPIYSLRHLQHHAGQLGAFLRRVKVSTRWTARGAEQA